MIENWVCCDVDCIILKKEEKVYKGKVNVNKWKSISIYMVRLECGFRVFVDFVIYWVLFYF